ncbi:MAG: NAD-dependent epimerase/dehydratase family protein [Phycisphaeraceae bacterium]
MNVLLIGGGGHVGSILRPALEAAHRVHHLDLKPVPGAEDRTITASVTDEAALAEAVAGRDAVVYLAMGRFNPKPEVQSMFDVNVQGVYLALRHAMKAGVRRFVYASTLSVYQLARRKAPLDETREPDSWDTYGLTKRLGEQVCEIGSRRYPEATITALRLMLPLNEHRWEKHQTHPDRAHTGSYPTGPRDLQRLFLAALALQQPGMHVVQATGDQEGEHFPHDRARELLGWMPQGE